MLIIQKKITVKRKKKKEDSIPDQIEAIENGCVENTSDEENKNVNSTNQIRKDKNGEQLKSINSILLNIGIDSKTEKKKVMESTSMNSKLNNSTYSNQHSAKEKVEKEDQSGSTHKILKNKPKVMIFK